MKLVSLLISSSLVLLPLVGLAQAQITPLYDPIRAIPIEITQLEQQTSRIRNLEEEVFVLKDQLQTVQHRLASLEEQVTARPEPVTSWLEQLVLWVEDGNGPMLSFPTLVLLLVSLTLVWISWRWLQRHKVETIQPKQVSSLVPDPSSEEPEDTLDEYDFLGSSEGIPAKLDLARAYIDMGDANAARTVLREVIAQGNAEQVAQARELLKKLPS